MTGLGIYHYNARFYSPKLGRFLSADSIVPNPANPQDLNRYSYVRNNPLRYTDPTGNRPCGDGEKYDCDGKLNPTTPPAPKPPVVIVPNPKPEKDPEQNPDGLPQELIEQLIAVGVSEDFLSTVELKVYDDEPLWAVGCWGPIAARTLGNKITFCSSENFDPNRVNPYLVHELVHVRQWGETENMWIKNVLEDWSSNGNAYEQEAYACGDSIWQSYNVGKDLPMLNTAPCNLP